MDAHGNTNTVDGLHRNPRPILSLEQSPSQSRPASYDYDERAQRRYSATIRAVPPDWEDEATAPSARPRPREANEMLSPLPRPARSRQNDAEAGTPHAAAFSDQDAGSGRDLVRAPKPSFVRSRTKTLDDVPRHVRSQQAAASPVNGESAHAKRSMAHSPPPPLARIESLTISTPTPEIDQNGFVDETRRLRPSRHRAVNAAGLASPNAEATIIKVITIAYWATIRPLAPPPRKSRSAAAPPRQATPRHHEWQTVSAVLRQNGELRLCDLADQSVLASVRLSQFPRHAVQQLHRSVLDRRFCVAIYPQYGSSPVAMTPARPCYMALESREKYEGWWALLRLFSAPELYGPDPRSPGSSFDDGQALDDAPHLAPAHDMFRLERAASLRVIEARLRPATRAAEKSSTARSSTRLKDQGYFVELLVDGITRARTVTRQDPSSLFWREEYDFFDLPRSVTGATLIVKQHSASGSGDRSQPDVRSSDDAVVCGKVQVEFIHRSKDDAPEAWHQILNDEKEVVGDVLLRVKVEELTVMLLEEYQPLASFLRSSQGLGLQLAQRLPRYLQRLSEILVNVFQASGQASDWLMLLAEGDIGAAYQSTATCRSSSRNRAGPDRSSYENIQDRELAAHELGKAMSNEVNLLFRGNSLLTRAVDYYMRLVGREFLEVTLADVLGKINEAEDDCEVDPSRLEAPETIQRNWSNLVKHFREIWAAIRRSGPRCPPEIRLLLRHIRACCEERFGAYHHTVRYSSVSGFLFLRFFCPAVLNPKLFGLLQDHPRPAAQRTLTLIAKSLQGLANMSTFGSKESWMEPMNSHLVVHRQEFLEFIDYLCSVTAKEVSEQLATPPASYATPKTILFRLPLAHREGFPSLPYLIDEARMYASLVDVWLDSEPDLQSVQTAAGDLQRFHELCVYLRRRSQECVTAIFDGHQHPRQYVHGQQATPDQLSQSRILPVIPSLERKARLAGTLDGTGSDAFREGRRKVSSPSTATTTTFIAHHENSAVAGIISNPVRPTRSTSSPSQRYAHQPPPLSPVSTSRPDTSDRTHGASTIPSPTYSTRTLDSQRWRKVPQHQSPLPPRPATPAMASHQGATDRGGDVQEHHSTETRPTTADSTSRPNSRPDSASGSATGSASASTSASAANYRPKNAFTDLVTGFWGRKR